MQTRNLRELSFEEATKVLLDCFTVLFARYKVASTDVDVVRLTKDDVQRSSVEVRVDFMLKGFVNKEDIL